MKFDAATHSYFNDAGVRVPSVSNVLDLLYGSHYGNSDEPADQGTYIHGLCQSYLIGLDPDGILPEAVAKFKYFPAFLNNEKIRPGWDKIETESRFLSPHGYAGTRDIVLHDRHMIIDIKTGQENKERDAMQLIAYRDNLGYCKLFNLYLTNLGYRLIERKFSNEKFRLFLCGVAVLNFNKKF